MGSSLSVSVALALLTGAAVPVCIYTFYHSVAKSGPNAVSSALDAARLWYRRLSEVAFVLDSALAGAFDDAGGEFTALEQQAVDSHATVASLFWQVAVLDRDLSEARRFSDGLLTRVDAEAVLQGTLLGAVEGIRTDLAALKTMLVRRVDRAEQLLEVLDDAVGSVSADLATLAAMAPGSGSERWRGQRGGRSSL